MLVLRIQDINFAQGFFVGKPEMIPEKVSPQAYRKNFTESTELINFFT